VYDALNSDGESMGVMQSLDMMLHIDKSLGVIIDQYGMLVYIVLFAIAFCETGLVVLPSMSGDSLLFIAGALLWVIGLIAAGYLFGNIPIIGNHLNTIVLIGVGAAVIPVGLGAIWKLSRRVLRY
jgi:membrane-associated protein